MRYGRFVVLNAMENSIKKENEEKEIRKTPKIPKSVPFILFNILIERYSTTAISGELINYQNVQN